MEGKRAEKGGGREGRGGEGRKGPFPLFLFYKSTTGMVPIMGPKQTLCTRALALHVRCTCGENLVTVGQ